MQVEYTGRQATITPAMREMVEEGLERVARLLGAKCTAHVVLSAEKYRHTADITVQCRRGQIIGLCESPSADTALRDAIEKVESQAIRRKDRQRARKRVPKAEKLPIEPQLARVRKALVPPLTDEPPAAPVRKANGAAKKPPAAVVVHSRAEGAPVAEPHVVHSQDLVARLPMTLEEAVKEAEQRDRDVFVFRNDSGAVNVLHRRRDGTMELIQAI
jgi:putative sigma-54 modulation protein